MALFPNSYVKIGQSSNVRINYIVDKLMTPRLLSFRQITIFDERAVLQSDGITWRLSYPSWNEDFPEVVRLNGAKINSGQYSINYILGYITLAMPVQAGDNINVTYNIDWFPIGILEGMIYQCIDILNTAPAGSPTNYTIDTAPASWDGVIADLAYAMAIEKLLLDFDLWYGRLVFAIQGVEDTDDIVSVLEQLKQNAEERANKSIENEKFKVPNLLKPPTRFYWQGIRGVGRTGSSCSPYGYGKTRGYRPNKWPG